MTTAYCLCPREDVHATAECAEHDAALLARLDAEDAAEARRG